MATATRLSALDQLYHYRREFNAGQREPCYLVKFPPGVRVREVWGLLTAFHIV